MSDLVQRLRNSSKAWYRNGAVDDGPAWREAADEIKRLTAQLKYAASTGDECAVEMEKYHEEWHAMSDTIERLTGELRDARNGYSVRDDEVTGLMAMNAELTRERDAIDKMAKNLGDALIARGNQLSNMTAERDRLASREATLRDALLNIAEGSEPWAAGIARGTLRGEK